MGLDMFLTRKSKTARNESESLIYWRKANQIHGWFERNTADGQIENCEMYPVCLEDLHCLMEDCKLVQHEHRYAANVLPTCEGFFFGSQEYGEDYYQDIDYTIAELEKVLPQIAENEELFYHAWW